MSAADRDVIEAVAAALYDRAMCERATCLRNFTRPGDWWDESYVGPLSAGESRPVNWRDGWREEARQALASVLVRETSEELEQG